MHVHFRRYWKVQLDWGAGAAWTTTCSQSPVHTPHSSPCQPPLLHHVCRVYIQSIQTFVCSIPCRLNLFDSKSVQAWICSTLSDGCARARMLACLSITSITHAHLLNRCPSEQAKHSAGRGDEGTRGGQSIDKAWKNNPCRHHKYLVQRPSCLFLSFPPSFFPSFPPPPTIHSSPHITANLNNSMASLSDLSPRPTFAEGEDPRSRHSTDARPEAQDETSKVKSLPLRKSKTTDSYKPGRRSLAFFTDRFRSRPQSMMEEDGNHADSSTPTSSKNSSGGFFSRRKSSDDDTVFKHSGRRSSDFTGTYADIARAQAVFMEKLRDEQMKNNVKTNVDGLPLRPASPPADNRRISMTQALGMNKALLAR